MDDTIREGGASWDELTPEEQHLYGRIGYESNRREGNAVWREWRSYRLAGAAILLGIVLAVGMVVFALRSQKPEVVVQVVQVDEESKMVKIGVPIALLDYKPHDGAYRDMVSMWVYKRQSRDDSPSEVQARADWHWLYLHTCGMARKMLQAAEQVEKPFDRSIAKTRQVKVETVTQTDDPKRFHVHWRSTTIEKANPEAIPASWTTSFTVGRVTPASKADANQNNLGLCVTWYDDHQRQ